MRYRVLVIVLICAILVVPVRRSYAVIPVAIWAASAIWNTVIIGGLAWLTLGARENGGTRNPAGSKVTSSGSIGRDAKVTWVDLTATPPVVKEKDICGRLTADDMSAATSTTSGQTQYPSIAAAIAAAKKGYLDTTDPEQNLIRGSVGQVLYFGGAYWELTGVVTEGDYSRAGTPYNPGYHDGGWLGGVYRINFFTSCTFDGSVARSHQVLFSAKAVTKPATGVVDPKTLQSLLSDGNGNLQSGYSPEADSMFKNGYGSMVDTADPGSVDNAPLYNPPSPPSASAVASAINQAATDAAWQNYSSNKTPDNYAAWQQALSNQANSAAMSDAVKNGVKDAIEEESTGNLNTGTQDYGQNPSAPDKRDILAFLRDSIASLVANSPLLAIFKNTHIDTANSCSTLTFKLGIGNAEKTIDFAPFSGPLGVLGAAILAFAHLLAVFILFGRD